MDTEARDKIIQAVIRLMRTKDMKSISIRTIAREAGVNSAAISYYFQGKVPLFCEAMRQYWAQMIAVYEQILKKEQITDKEAEAFCLQILNYELNSTGILRSEQSMYIDFDMDADTKERIRLQLKAVGHMVCCVAPNTAQEMIFPKVLSAITSLTGPALFPEAEMENIADIELQKNLYVKQIVRNMKS